MTGGVEGAERGARAGSFFFIIIMYSLIEGTRNSVER